MRFPPELSLDAARAEYFRANGFAPNAPEWFIPIHFGRFTLPFPNSDARRRALPLHDTHHVATGYDTDLAGEAEIAAFELAGGCGRYWLAWFYDLGAFAVGLVAWPRRTFRAFVRGRRAVTLYRHPERMRVETVGQLQRAIGLTEQLRVRLTDLLAFAGMIPVLLVYAATWPLVMAILSGNAVIRSRSEGERVDSRPARP